MKFTIERANAVKFRDNFKVGWQTVEDRINHHSTNCGLLIYYGLNPKLGYIEPRKHSLVIRFNGDDMTGFVETGVFDFKKEYPMPDLFSEFRRCVESFVENAREEYIDLCVAHYNENPPDNEEDEFLPF